MTSNYYSIDDILCEEEQISVKFLSPSNNNLQLLELAGSGFQNTECLQSTNNVPENSTMELSLWLALPLVQAQFIEFSMPRIYSMHTQNTISADPIIINLQEKSNYFFDLGVKLSNLLDDRLQGKLVDWFITRMKDYIQASQRAWVEDLGGRISKMTVMERNIFNSGRKVAMDYRHWKERKEKEAQLYSQVSLKLKKMKNQF